MEGYDASTYGERIADVYDDWYGEAEFLETDAAVDGAGRAGGRRAGSRARDRNGPDRAAARRARRRGARDRRVRGDGREAPREAGRRRDPGHDGRLRRRRSRRLLLARLRRLQHPFRARHSQDEQVRCFAERRRAPRARRRVRGRSLRPRARQATSGLVNVSKIESGECSWTCHLVDRAEQRSESQHVVMTPEGARFYPVSIRWAYPAELDLMARLAGLRLRRRWAGWKREPFSEGQAGSTSPCTSGARLRPPAAGRSRVQAKRPIRDYISSRRAE